MDRRTFLRLGMGGAALVAAQPILGRDPANAQPAPGPFGHGVASGDPLPDRAIIWTRVTPAADATPGSGRGPRTTVTWEVAGDAGFTDVIASGSVTTTAAADHTVKVDVAGLRPGRDHWYRFQALGTASPVGRLRTAPAPGAGAASLRMGVVSCSNYEGGYFSAYRHLAARDDLDLVVHLGDYLYETPAGAYGPGAAYGRAHDPATEIVTLEDYRRRHALYKTDPDLAALHRRYAFVTTIDDHEVTDNSWADGAGNHQPGEGAYAARRAAAMQAYFEWMPIRPADGDDPTRLYRRSSFGDLADVFVLDERSYRSEQVRGARADMIVTSPEVDDPARTMLGDEQRRWLEDGLAASTAPWKIIANSVMFAPLVLADLPDIPEVTPLLQQLLASLGVSPPVVLNGDQWDGYRVEQTALREVFRAAGGVVLLTGDIHSSWAAEVPVDPATYLPLVGGATAAVEFVTPAVTSNAFGPALAGIIPGGEALAPQLPLLVTTAGPWFKYLDGDRHGFGVFEVTEAAAQFDWYFISDRADPRASLVDGPSWRSLAGSNTIQAAPRLGPRAMDVPSPPSAPAPPAAPEPPVPEAPVDRDAQSGVDGGVAGSGGSLPATGTGVPLAVAAGAAVAGLSAAAMARRAGASPAAWGEIPPEDRT